MAERFPLVIVLGIALLIEELLVKAGEAEFRKKCLAVLQQTLKSWPKILPLCFKALMVLLRHIIIWWAGIGGLFWILPISFDDGDVVFSFIFAFMVAICSWGIMHSGEIKKIKNESQSLVTLYSNREEPAETPDNAEEEN